MATCGEGLSGSTRFNFDDTWELSWGAAAEQAGSGRERTLLAATTGAATRAALSLTAVTAGRIALAVSVTTSQSGPAEIAVFDIIGRRVLTRLIDLGGAATQEIHLAERGAIAPGVYLLELRQGARTARTKATVLR